MRVRINLKSKPNLRLNYIILYTFPVSWLDSHVLITGLYGIGGREERKTNNKKKYYTLNNL